MIDKLIEQQEIIKGMQENQDSAIKIMKMYEDLKKDYIRVKSNEKTLADLLNKEQKKNKKAIEYCYELQERYCHSALFDDLVASKIYEISEKQLNILKGEDKE